MLAEKKAATNHGIVVGLLLQVVGLLLQTGGHALALVGLVVILLGVGCFVRGCEHYCRGKGYPGALGWLGLLNCVGLAVLVLLPDTRRGAYRPYRRAVSPPSSAG